LGVFDVLIESKRRKNRKKAYSVGFVSLVIHTAVIAGAVYATLHAGESDTGVRVDTAMVFIDQQQQQKPPEQQPVQLDVPLKGFQTVIAPDVIPTNIPPVNLSEKFDPKDYSGSGVEGGLSTGMVPTGNEVFLEAIVEEKPSVLSGPPPQYPELLRQAGIQGRVMVQAIIDTTGRAEGSSIKIVSSPNPGFDPPAKNYVLKALFRPARVHGRAVRVLINIPIDFKITGR
jgi:protein TonB